MQIRKEYKLGYIAHRNQELIGTKCERVHGHQYKLFCVFDVVRQGNISTLFDDFDRLLEPMFKNEFDHRMLIDRNDPLLVALVAYEAQSGEELGLKILPFPTSVENVCFYLFDQIMGRFPQLNLVQVDLQETQSSTVIYTRSDYYADQKVLAPTGPS